MRGWTLPSSNDYVSLITNTYSIGNNEAGSSKIQSAPLEFNFTGAYVSSKGILGDSTTRGLFWSNTTLSDTVAYGLNIGSSNVVPQSNFNRGYGNALRCTAK